MVNTKTNKINNKLLSWVKQIDNLTINTITNTDKLYIYRLYNIINIFCWNFQA